MTRSSASTSRSAKPTRSHDAEAIDRLMTGLRLASPRLARFADHAMAHPRFFALNVSNVRGPASVPSVLGAPVRALHTLAEVGGHHALRVAAVSLADVLSIGFCADPTLIGGLDPMVEGFEDDAAALADAGM